MALTPKQRRFIDEYLIDFNATQAAIRAGYSEKSAHNIGWENVRKREISEAISQRLQESAMMADEVLMRLADQARSTMEDFVTVLDNGDFIVDLNGAKEAGKLHLVKKLKETRHTDKDGNVEVKLDLELYDSHAALVDLGKYHKLFTDKQEVDLTSGGEPLSNVLESLLSKSYASES